MRRRLIFWEFKVSEPRARADPENLNWNCLRARCIFGWGGGAGSGIWRLQGLACEVIREPISGAKGYRGRYPAAGAVFSGRFQVPCARCVEPVEIPLAAEFDLIFRPAGADSEAPERSITAPETEIGYYQKDSLLLEDVLREQVLLSLPVRTLCKPDCKGLCPRCGQNRNTQECSCEVGPSDPRWEALAGLRGRLES